MKNRKERLQKKVNARKLAKQNRKVLQVEDRLIALEARVAELEKGN